MLSDAEIARDTHLHETGKNMRVDALDIALVRAGRIAVLREVVEREGGCSYQNQALPDVCSASLPDNPADWCSGCWATAQLKETDDAKS